MTDGEVRRHVTMEVIIRVPTDTTQVFLDIVH